ncbi:hypothetical protein VOLCADRAFT_119316 [Volvox carteri f. nagariensis]|uniref:LTD domain-containing protein n=1 Tax=Volvox carteri f. nagariensis TaxID=3068 RepID=D8UC51_VOLCA|nr:uncharacterized protein VOLCADRAFT_119316 [Volvox carteri f. nagariensis]EFJ42738.1 hypothetical protein VOLCADRAFT_119316 [Volvox carteri f. nagariensis]|eukprot:XP_002956199.1 hypothetical protein VOLCADRAFT_119316 [Volvox carteri f. nagariensis]
MVGQTAAGVGSGNSDVRINELMAANQGAVLDERGRSPDWVELFNPGQGEVQLGGWMLRTPKENWTFPQESSIPAGGYLLVYTSGKSQSSNDAATGPAGSPPPIRAALKLSADGESVSLLRPDGSAASLVGPDMARQPANISFGVPGTADSGDVAAASRDAAVAAPLTFLARPTPGAANSGPMAHGPFIHSVSRATQPPRAPAGSDIPVNITVEPNLQNIDEQNVVLSYVINFGEEQDLPAVKVASGSGRNTVFTASIPSSAFKSGDMVRWRAKVTDTAGHQSIFPGPPGPSSSATTDSEGKKYPRYFGTVVAIPASDLVTDQVPVLEWFSPDPAAATTRDGAEGQVLFYNGCLYDNVFSRRRGVTALNWPKPKLKFELPQTNFEYAADMPPVGEFGLQSFWYELGERSYMKETLALQLMRDAGVLAPNSFHVHVRQNGHFYGLFAFVEIPDMDFLSRHKLPRSGPMFKSVSGELSNLRWDLPIKEMPAYWEKENSRQRDTGDWVLLANLSKGLAGGSPVPRSKYIFDAVNLPQDLLRSTPWGQVSATLNGAYEGPAVRKSPGGQRKRRLLQQQQQQQPQQATQQDATPPTVPRTRRRAGGASQPGGGGGGAAGMEFPYKAAGNNITTFPMPRGWDNPDRSTISQTSPNGPTGTYNHLYDAILDVASARAMYMRRLRSMADKYLAGGVLAQFANQTYVRIKPLADLDAKTWNSGISIDRGFQQITQEFLPVRKEQLLGALYGPKGRRPLLPEAQPAQVSLRIARFVTAESGTTGGDASGFLEVANPNQFAVDVSGWRLEGPATFTFPPGTVIPSAASAFITVDPVEFRSRTTPPSGGQGLLVLSPLQLGEAAAQGGGSGGASSAASSGPYKLIDTAGTSVHQMNTGTSRKLS